MVAVVTASELWAAYKAYAPEKVASVTARQCGFVIALERWFGNDMFTCEDLVGRTIPGDVASRMAMKNVDASDVHMIVGALAASGFLKVSGDRWTFALTPQGRMLADMLGGTYNI